MVVSSRSTFRTVTVVALLVALAGCGSEAPPAADPTSGPTSGATSGPVDVVTTSSASSPPPPARKQVRRLVVPAAADTMPTTWSEVFVVPYGPGRDRLGTSQGGDAGGTVLYGPEYGAPAPDGSWWFLDAGKQRLARYDATGDLLEAVPTRPLGTGFPWQLPHVLDDGTLVAFRLTPDAGAMLRLRDGVLDEVPLASGFSPTYDDGRLLYGTVLDGAPLAVLDPDTGAVTSTSSYRLPSGAAFSVTDDFDAGVLEVETATASLRLPTVTSSDAVAHMGLQLSAGDDDSVHLFLAGYGDDDSTQLLGYVRIDASGEVSALEPLSDPFSSADPGGPGQIVPAPGADPMLVYVMADGVHVYRRG